MEPAVIDEPRKGSMPTENLAALKAFLGAQRGSGTSTKLSKQRVSSEELREKAVALFRVVNDNISIDKDRLLFNPGEHDMWVVQLTCENALFGILAKLLEENIAAHTLLNGIERYCKLPSGGYDVSTDRNDVDRSLLQGIRHSLLMRRIPPEACSNASVRILTLLLSSSVAKASDVARNDYKDEDCVFCCVRCYALTGLLAVVSGDTDKAKNLLGTALSFKVGPHGLYAHDKQDDAAELVSDNALIAALASTVGDTATAERLVNALEKAAKKRASGGYPESFDQAGAAADYETWLAPNAAMGLLFMILSNGKG